MKHLIVTSLLIVLGVWGLTNVAWADRNAAIPEEFRNVAPAQASPTTFATIDITIDPKGQPLGAYQFELTSTDASFTVVGVEAGEHAAFDHGRPPYFDPIAQQNQVDRLIVAEYALPQLAADQLPTQSVRVATVHVMFTGQLDEQVDLTLTLTTAGNADGQPIDATISHTLQVPERS